MTIEDILGFPLLVSSHQKVWHSQIWKLIWIILKIQIPPWCHRSVLVAPDGATVQNVGCWAPWLYHYWYFAILFALYSFEECIEVKKMIWLKTLLNFQKSNAISITPSSWWFEIDFWIQIRLGFGIGISSRLAMLEKSCNLQMRKFLIINELGLLMKNLLDMNYMTAMIQ